MGRLRRKSARLRGGQKCIRHPGSSRETMRPRTSNLAKSERRKRSARTECVMRRLLAKHLLVRRPPTNRQRAKKDRTSARATIRIDCASGTQPEILRVEQRCTTYRRRAMLTQDIYG